MGDFEKDLRDAFEGVEFTPSEQVWHGVEKGLRPKKKGVFFMWQTYGVAATLVFLLSMGYLFRDQLFNAGNEDPVGKELTQQEGKPEKETEKEITKGASDEPASDPAVQNPAENDATPGITDLQSSRQANESTGESDKTGLSNTTNSLALVRDEQAFITARTSSVPVESTAEGEELLIDPAFMGPLTPQVLKESTAALTARWELENLVGLVELKENQGELPTTEPTQNLTSLNGTFGSSVFNPNSSLNNMDVALAEQAFDDPRFDQLQAASNGEESQLGSISVGFGVGLPLGERWLIKTGLRYSQYRFATTANAYSIEDGQELPIYTRVAFNNAAVLASGEYEITNTLHSLSVPVQLGWKFLDLGRFDSWVNVGVAADYIVSYTVKGDLNFLETRQVDFSQSTFINRFNLNALTGLEFTYELNPKLALSGEVYFRQFVPVSDTDAAYNSTPSVLGFGLGVNYYLRKKK